MVITKKTHCFSCSNGRLQDFGFVLPIIPGYERRLDGCNKCGATKVTWIGKKFTRSTGAGVVNYKR